MNPSYADCRRASRSIRRSGQWPTVRAAVRPRGLSWLFRGRPPLAVLLRRAAVEGRLIWRSPDEMTMLDAPAAGHRPHWLDRYWEPLVFFGPVAGCWGVALAGLAWWPVSVALSLVLAGLGWTLLLLATAMTAMFVDLARSLRQDGPRDESRFARLAREHWSVGLLHVGDPAQVPAVVGEAVALAGAEVLCRTEVITTTESAAAMKAVPGVRRLSADSGVLVLPAGPRPQLTVPSGRAALGPMLLWIPAGIVVAVAVSAQNVASAERDGCAAVACPERPTTYWSAVYWLLNRLSGGDPNGLGAVTFQGRTLGLLITLMSVVLVGFVINMVLGKLNAQSRDIGREAAEAFNAATPTADPDAAMPAAGLNAATPAAAVEAQTGASRPASSLGGAISGPARPRTAGSGAMVAAFALGMAAGATVLRALRRDR